MNAPLHRDSARAPEVSARGSRGSADAAAPIFPARTALRVTVLVSLSFMAAVTWTGSIGRTGALAFLWVSALTNVLVAYHPRIPERARELYVSGTWLLVGLTALFESGLLGGPLTMMVALGLTGLFFGRRRALAALALAAAAMMAAGFAELHGEWSPRFPTRGDLVEEWGINILFFIAMALMLTLTQAATLARAERASARARQFALAAEHSDRAMFVLDAAGAVAWVNEAFARTTGIPQERAVGRTLADLLSGSATDLAALERLGPSRGGEARRAELVLYPSAGEPFRASVELRPMSGTPGCSGLLLDVTETHARGELEEVQRALSLELSGAATREEASRALVRAVSRASSVLGARVLEVLEGQPRLVAHAGPLAPRPPAAELEAALSTPGAPVDDALDADGAAVPRSEPLPHVRARFAISGPPDGVLEVWFALDVPGRGPLMARLPALVEQVVRHDRRIAEQARFEALFDRSPDALVLLDGAGRVVRHNPLASRLWPPLLDGSTPDWPAALRAACERPGGDDLDGVRSVAWQHDEGEEARDLEASVAPLSLPEGPGVLVSARDVTARRAAERSLERALVDVRAALEEREVLLREIHHRVKNNLQIVSSLLSMQADRGTSAEVQAALEESAQRVRSLALIHQQLYGGDNLARIQLDSYVRTLASELCGSLAPTAKLEFETRPTEVEAEQAIPCGLILNELIVNALKHGREPGGGARVRISVGVEEDRIHLAVADTGPGMPPGFDPTKLSRATSLGLRLVAALTRQLGATLRVEPGPGARLELRVPLRSAGGATRG